MTLIGIIGLWVLETAVGKYKSGDLDKREEFILNVNLSAIQFLGEVLGQKILKVLDDY